jgi:hypothetical protein
MIKTYHFNDVMSEHEIHMIVYRASASESTTNALDFLSGDFCMDDKQNGVVDFGGHWHIFPEMYNQVYEMLSMLEELEILEWTQPLHDVALEEWSKACLKHYN